MTKEEIALHLTIAVINRTLSPSDNNDEFYSTICKAYNSIYDNIVSNKMD